MPSSTTDLAGTLTETESLSTPLPSSTTPPLASPTTTTEDPDTTTPELPSPTADPTTSPPPVDEPTQSLPQNPISRSTTTLTVEQTLSAPSPSASIPVNNNNNAAAAPTKGFFANTAAVTATFTVLGVIVAAIALYFITSAVRRRRAENLEREIEEAAAVRDHFNGRFDDDDDRMPFGQQSAAPMAAVGATGLVSRPSTSSHSVSAYSAYSGGYPVQQPQYPNAYYNGANGAYGGQPPVPPIPAILPAHARATPAPADVEPDVYSYNPTAAPGPVPTHIPRAASSDDAHLISPTRRTFGAQGVPPAAQGVPTAAYGAALVRGMSRYAQMQAAAAQQEHRRTPSAPRHPGQIPTPPPPGRAPQRMDSAQSVQHASGYGQNRMSGDLKVRTLSSFPLQKGSLT